MRERRDPLGRLFLGFTLILAIAIPGRSDAHGVLLPTDRALSPFLLERHEVTASVAEGLAETHAREVFRNVSGQTTAGIFLFPLPRDAAVSRVLLTVDGERRKGNLTIGRETAQAPFPFLAYGDHRFFSARIDPVASGERVEIEIRYEEVIPWDQGISELRYPMAVTRGTVSERSIFTLTVDLRAPVPLGTVYSPTHEVGIYRKDPHRARVSFQGKGEALERDFLLYATARRKEEAFELRTFRRPGEAGYFLMTLSPPFPEEGGKGKGKDLFFLLDTSGSMRGEKLAWAKTAVIEALSFLSPSDRFMLVPFATRVDRLDRRLRPANKANVRRGMAFVEQLRAGGGSALQEALRSVLDLPADPERERILLLFSDGFPTIGLRTPARLLPFLAQHDAAGTRIFPVGIGRPVNSGLLEALASANRGTTDFIDPSIEHSFVIRRLMRRIHQPCLTDLHLSARGIELFDIRPTSLPDLSAGSPLIVLGRYSGSGKARITLTGNLGGKVKRYRWKGVFPKEDREDSFVERLLQSRSSAPPVMAKEEEGLLQRSDVHFAEAGSEGRQWHDPAASRAPQSLPVEPRHPTLYAPTRSERSGQTTATRRSDRSLGRGKARIRKIGNRAFRRYHDIWLDRAFRPGMATLHLPYDSPTYLRLRKERPDLAEALSLGERVVVVTAPDRAIIVSSAPGLEDPGEAALQAFLPPLPR
ncbi:MAG: VWA domain-containing protein [Deltaproteobacteria bacterium]|nr:MAG: VWA domain-containing protein [Deltaproteobacteria bacterium]